MGDCLLVRNQPCSNIQIVCSCISLPHFWDVQVRFWCFRMVAALTQPFTTCPPIAHALQDERPKSRVWPTQNILSLLSFLTILQAPSCCWRLYRWSLGSLPLLSSHLERLINYLLTSHNLLVYDNFRLCLLVRIRSCALLRCLCTLSTRKTTTRRPSRHRSGTRNLCRLVTWDSHHIWTPHYQPHRQGAPVVSGVLQRWTQHRLESKTVFIYWICSYGWWTRWERGQFDLLSLHKEN